LKLYQLGWPRSRFWDLGEDEFKVRNHPARDLVQFS